MTQGESPRRVLLGRLTRPHGVRGEMGAQWYAESTDLLDGPLVLEHPKGSFTSVEVGSWRVHKDGLLLRLKGVDDRDAAERLRGASLWVDRDLLPEPGEDEAYIDDLVGRTVVDARGNVLGVLHHIETPPGQILFAIRDGEFEHLLPARPEFLVDLGDPVVVDPPEGLLETCRTPLKSAPGAPSSEGAKDGGSRRAGKTSSKRRTDRTR